MVLGLLSHEQRCLRGDLIEAYKILNGKDIVVKATFFQLSPTVSTLRGHNMKLSIPRARLHVRKYFFSHRVVLHWNSLPQHVVNASSVNSFKSQLDTYWHDMDVKSRWASWSINYQVQAHWKMTGRMMGQTEWSATSHPPTQAGVWPVGQDDGPPHFILHVL